MDYGIRVVIAPSFGDIFFENCFKNGVLAVVLPADAAAGLRRDLAERPGAAMTVDLETQMVTGPAGAAIRFEIDAFRKHGLLTGQDEVEMTLARLPRSKRSRLAVGSRCPGLAERSRVLLAFFATTWLTGLSLAIAFAAAAYGFGRSVEPEHTDLISLAIFGVMGLARRRGCCWRRGRRREGSPCGSSRRC